MKLTSGLKLSLLANILFIGVLIWQMQRTSGVVSSEPGVDNLSRAETVCDVVIKEQQKNNIEAYTGEPAPVNFDSNPDAKLFRTTIDSQVAEGANFAGHYTVATWGCGTSCTGYAIVDVITGNIVDYVPYYENQALEGFVSSVSSNILVFNPRPKNMVAKTAQEILSEDGQAYYARVYYDLVESTDDTTPLLRKLCTENVYSGLVK